LNTELFEDLPMGACLSALCPKRSREEVRLDQYLNLVASKPSPVTLEQIDLSGSTDTDVPLFAQVSDDSEEADGPTIKDAPSSEGDASVVKKTPNPT
jgi:hypothetical protein